MLRLLRLLRRNVAPDPPALGVDHGRERAPARSPHTGGSTFTTSAPSRARSWVAYGSACIGSSGQDAHAVERLAVGGCLALITSPSRMRRVRRNVTVCQVRRPDPLPRHPEKYDDPSDLAVAWSGWPPGGSSTTAPTCRTAGSTAPRSPPSPAAGAARAPARWPPTTRTPPRWPSRRPAALRRRPTACRPARVLDHAPPYVDKTNATAVHAALRLPPTRRRFDLGGAVRSAVGALRPALAAGEPALVVAADVRTGLPGSPDEADRGRRRRRASRRGPTTAPCSPSVGRRRPPPSSSTGGARPGDARSKRGRSASARPSTSPLGAAAWEDALEAAGLDGRRGRPGRRRRARTPGPRRRWARSSAVGDRRCRRPRRHRRQRRRRPARPAAGRRARARPRPARSSPWWCWPTAPTSCCSAPPTRSPAPPARRRRPGRGRRALAYGSYLRLAGLPAGRAAPAPRAGPPVGQRRRPSADWKFGFVGSQGDDRRDPPAAGRPATTPRRPMADATGTVVTFTVDRLAYSPARRWCSPWSTSTAAAGCRSS